MARPVPIALALVLAVLPSCDGGGGEDVATGTQRRDSTSIRPPGTFPVDGDRLDAAHLLLYDGDELALVDYDGREISRIPRGDWYLNRPDRGVDLNSTAGGVHAVEAPAFDDSIPGCKDVQPGPGERDFDRVPTSGYRRGGTRAAVCWPDPDLPSEVHVVAADGTTRKLAGPLDRTGRWKYALPSPDGKVLLAQWSQVCDQRAILIDVDTGSQHPTADARAIGWTPGGRAVVGLGPSCPDDPAFATAERSTALLEPATGALQTISDLAAGAMVSFVDGDKLTRLERRLHATLDDLALPRYRHDAGTATLIEGSEVVIAAAPAEDPAPAATAGQVRFGCGTGRYTLAGAPPEALDRLAGLLATHLVCLRTPG